MESNALKQLVSIWQKQIDYAKAHRWRVWGESASIIWKYYGRKLEYPPEVSDEEGFMEEFLKKDHWRSTLGKTSQYVRVMLPIVHHKVPHRQVKPERLPIEPELYGLPPGMPIVPSQSEMKGKWAASLLHRALNYLVHANDLRRECRPMHIEALTKGRGVVWHEISGGSLGDVPFSSYDSVDNLVIDPDCRQVREAGWCARKRRRPAWIVAEEFGLNPDELKGQHKSYRQRAENDTRDEHENVPQSGEAPKDIIEYWEVYSRVGFGHKLSGAGDELKEARTALDSAGPYIYLAICPGVPYPLNMHPERMAVMGESEITASITWPIKFHEFPTEPWPFTELDYYPGVDVPWPSPPLESAIPLQAFLDSAYSYLSRKIRVTSRDLLVVADGLDPEVKAGLIDGLDHEVLQMKGKVSQNLQESIQWLQGPAIKSDIIQIIQAFDQAFEAVSGMSEAMSGATPARQMRSAAEAGLVQSMMSIRPEDMQEMGEDFHSRVSRKEAFMLRQPFITPIESVSRILGENQQEIAIGQQMVAAGQFGPTMDQMSGQVALPPGGLTQAWMMHVATDDPAEAASEYDYSVEAGTGRKRNKAKELQDVQDSAQAMLPMFMEYYGATGDSSQVNAWITAWAEAADRDPKPFLFPDRSAQMMMQQQQAAAQGAPPQAEGQPSEGEPLPNQ